MTQTSVASCAALLALLAACGGKPLPDWKTDPTPADNSKRVDHLERFNNSVAWQRSVFFRLDDKPEMPVFLIVANDRTACIAPVEDWTIANPGDYYPCPGQWRIARQ